jgi:hypothetical protein
MKRNFNELRSRMKPESQERAKARASEMLREATLAESAAHLQTPEATHGCIERDSVEELPKRRN